MLVVETIAKIRRAHFIQGKSIKQICRELRVSRNTVRKVIRSGATEFSYDRNEERVRGYFIKNKNFFLNENVATTIAQIACHNNSLPQGSPSSPVISNLLAHLLDMRISRIAKKARCSYTRYADDLTFSCSKKTFPGGIAVPSQVEERTWLPSDKLRHTIFSSGYKINQSKTRMQGVRIRRLQFASVPRERSFWAEAHRSVKRRTASMIYYNMLFTAHVAS